MGAPARSIDDAASCGILLVGLTDADGDFLSYSVDVVSLSLRNADVSVEVNGVPVAATVVA